MESTSAPKPSKKGKDSATENMQGKLLLCVLYGHPDAHLADDVKDIAKEDHPILFDALDVDRGGNIDSSFPV